MRYVRILAACLLMPVVLAGCSTTQGSGGSTFNWCGLAGAIAGAAIGAAVTDDDDGSDGEIGGAVIGGGIGAIASTMICNAGKAMPVAEVGDADGDGVADADDQCPDTPAGAAVDATGCPLYSDGDSVPDYLDKCPGTPSGVSVDADGCPIDTDGDGVPDGLDKCPGTPAGSSVDANGCSEVGQSLAVLSSINFDFNSARLRADEQPDLETVLSTLQANPNISVLVTGHTDSVGAKAYNKTLSLRRAESVRDWLVGRGIGAERLSVDGMGEDSPIASNETKDGRAQNRRVEFTVPGK